jgi:hypothetical protein
METVEKIKLPSNWSVVTPENLWRHISCIAKTGSVFTKEQLIGNGLYTKSDDAVSRNLSYLKYLGFVEEERGKGKDQKFKVIDNSQVKNLIYELKANREDSARSKFRALITNHEIYQVVRNEFFKADNSKTFIDFEHFLKDSIPGKSPQYYQNGGSFIIDLLKIAGVVSTNANDINLLDGKSENEGKDEKPEGANGSDKPKPEERPIQGEPDAALAIDKDPKVGKYSVAIKTPNINFNIELESEVDIQIVNSILDKVKKELVNEGKN